MTRRTKLWICVGLLVVLAVGAVLVCRPTGKPDVEASFVRYATNGAALLNFTNRGQSRVRLSFFLTGTGEIFLLHTESPDFPILRPRTSMQLFAQPIIQPRRADRLPGAKVSMHCSTRATSPLREGIEFLFTKVGINIASQDFLVTVTLQPPETAASPSPAH